MEVDDGLVADSVFTNTNKSGQKSVHFEEESIDIPVDVELTVMDEESAAVRPKHKARRRSRNSSSGSKDEEELQAPHPRFIAPSKLRKLSDKDRHVSRSGKGRGKPKKG